MKNNYFVQIYCYKELIMALADKEVKIKYKSAVLGHLWALLNPLLLMLVFSVVFSVIIRVEISNFPVFLLCALLPWFYLSFSLTASTTSIVDNASLIKKAYFPHEVIPLSIVIANLFNFLISLVLLFAFLLFYSIYPSWAWFYLPLVVLLQSVFVLGLCLLSAAMHTMFRDVKYIVELILLVWFYATPIFYPLSFVPDNIRPFFLLNPLTVFINLYREILLQGKMAEPGLLFLAFALSIAFFALGMVVFIGKKKSFADVT
ncbi:MAG: ABC transporter permease [Candidatus Omnitrophica bacterium]|nr:ABC transporter permease [Candidatus Omnitrophota bacterium]